MRIMNAHNPVQAALTLRWIMGEDVAVAAPVEPAAPTADSDVRNAA